MPESSPGVLSDASEARVLNGRAVILHHKHIQAGIRTDAKGCGFCKLGVGALVTASTRTVAEPVVREGPGVDEEKSAPLPSDGGWFWDDDGLLRQKGEG